MNQHNGSRSSDGYPLATLAGGCFWCLEAVYNELRGVESALSGYAGGHDPDPTYEAVCSGTTGHAEVVQITYDPDMVSFRELLEVFFTIHDPTTLNRQGNDVGTQYRSAIYYHDEEQRLIADEVIEEMTVAGLWDDPIVTEVTALDMYYEAEEYHQRYFEKNPFSLTASWLSGQRCRSSARSSSRSSRSRPSDGERTLSLPPSQRGR